MTLAGDTDMDEIFDAVTTVDEHLFNANDKETLKIVDQSGRIAYPRELGDWITINIYGQAKSISWDCK